MSVNVEARIKELEARIKDLEAKEKHVRSLLTSTISDTVYVQRMKQIERHRAAIRMAQQEIHRLRAQEAKPQASQKQRRRDFAKLQRRGSVITFRKGQPGGGVLVQWDGRGEVYRPETAKGIWKQAVRQGYERIA